MAGCGQIRELGGDRNGASEDDTGPYLIGGNKSDERRGELSMAAERYRELLGNVREEEVVNLCSELVRFKSVNPPGDELEIAKYVAGILQEAGLNVEMVTHSPTRGSVIGRLKGRGEVRPILYSGHLDVVPEGEEEWLCDPFGGNVSEGKVWGRGATDMKGGDAAMIIAAKILAAATLPLKGDLILAFTAGEETDALGAHEIVRHYDLGPLQGIFIAEPSDNEVYIAEKGALWLEITTYGKTAHISRIEEGRNALMMMLPILSELDQLIVPYSEHFLLGHFARSITTLHAGIKTNTIPDRCVATVDQRTVPGQDHDMIVREVEKLITDVGKRIALKDFLATVRITNNRQPIETSPEEPMVQRLYGIVNEVTGRWPEPKGVGYYTDAVEFVPALKAPFVICGPGNPRLNHQTNEWVETAKLVEAANIYILTAIEFLM